ncbi:MAG: transketolase C-terminal domain-containing protein [Thermodesulfobacteriota bacterium]
MERDDSVFIYGIGVPDHKRIFGSTNGLLEKFGPERCFDTPIAEDTMAGIGLGAAINGLRPIHVHIRVDFLLLAMNQLANVISSYSYGTAGKHSAPMVFRAVVGRGWGQGFQHSKSMHAAFAHIPGLKVVAPTTALDAKGLLIGAIRDDNPVVFLEHRWLYWQEGEVPAEPFTLPIGKGQIIRQGSDLTIVATSWLNVEALHAAKILARHGVNLEIVDPRTLSPLDEELIISSVQKTGRCLVADNDWVFCGFGAEVAAMVSENCFKALKGPVRRIGFANTPCPTARHLENAFFPNAATIVRKVEEMLDLEPVDLSAENFYSHENRFKGPF